MTVSNICDRRTSPSADISMASLVGQAACGLTKERIECQFPGELTY